MPVVIPPGMIEDRIKADAVDRHAGCDGCTHFACDIREPLRPILIFRSCFRDEKRELIAMVDFRQYVSKGPVLRLAAPYGVAMIPPLIAIVVVDADYVEI